MTEKKTSFKDVFNTVFGRKSGPEQLAELNAKIAKLNEEKERLVETLRDGIQFEQILPESGLDIHEQLKENERVHLVGSVDELLQKRIGHENDNKRCFARVVREGKPEVNACIYTAFIKTEEQENVGYHDIPGNITDIKEMGISPLKVSKGDTVAVILYSISSNMEHDWERGGRPLAGSVYQYVNAWAAEQECRVILSTLSPVRGFASWLKTQPNYDWIQDENNQTAPEFLEQLNDEAFQSDVKALLLEYLLTERDPVLNFHLGNGAYIGDLKINADNPQDWAMINYVYPSNAQTRENNQEFYGSSKIRILAPHLHATLGQNKPELHTKSSCIAMTAELSNDSPAPRPEV